MPIGENEEVAPHVRLPAAFFSLIVPLRGTRVILDATLAEIYGVETRALNQAFRRNRDRFPEDFAFELTQDEWAPLRSRFVMSKGRGGRRGLPMAFTEHGALMLANILHSERALRLSILIVRAFVALRELPAAQADLSRRIAEIEQRLQAVEQAQGKSVDAITTLRDALHYLIEGPNKMARPIGFTADLDKAT